MSNLDVGGNQERVVECNPGGAWEKLEDHRVKDAIAVRAGLNHAHNSIDHQRFADFLDAFASAWLKQKADVEDEARKYKFKECEATADIPEDDRRRAALLCMTRNGSYVLLGNGCLATGGFGKYEKIPLRSAEGATKRAAKSGVCVSGDAALQRSLLFKEGPLGTYPLLLHGTSPLEALYYTTDTLSFGDAKKLGEALSESISHFHQTVRFGFGDTLQEDRPAKEHTEQEEPEPAHSMY